jgi:hypothetical protein
MQRFLKSQGSKNFRRCRLVVLLLLASVGNAWSQAPTLPKSIEDDVLSTIHKSLADDILRQCKTKPTRVPPSAVTKLDMNGDGIDDYIIEYEKVECGNIGCGNAGCGTVFWVSQSQGFVRGYSAASQGIERTERLAKGNAVIIGTHGSYCNRHGSDVCRYRLTFDKAKPSLTLLTSAGNSPNTSIPDTAILGAWAAIISAAPGIERQACAAVEKFGVAKLSGNTVGEVVVFTPTQRLDFGGYADTQSKRISMRRDQVGNFVLEDRFYHDGEGGGRPGFRVKRYVASVSELGRMELREGKFRTQYVKCGSSTPAPPTAGEPSQAKLSEKSAPPQPPNKLQSLDTQRPAPPPEVRTDQVIAQQSQANSAPNLSTTKFRGLFIGMTRADIDALQMNDFQARLVKADAKPDPCDNSRDGSCKLAGALGLLSKSPDRVILTSKVTGKECATLEFDKGGKADRMIFAKCLFGASDLGFDAFAQAIVTNYKIDRLTCKSDLDNPLAREYARKGLLDANPRTCSGLAKTGEKVTLTTGGFMDSDMTVEKATERPSFN